MNIAIVGFGREGKMAYEYWKAKANTFYIFDSNENLLLPEKCIPKLGADYKNKLVTCQDDFDFIVRSPGVPLWELESEIKKPITSITNEFFDKCPGKVIGVTGTKGKGTTSTLVYEILKESGYDAYLVGNIGTPALSILNKLTKNSIVVYELSSFQLFDLHKSPQIAVCLLITEDHLDWHENVSHYQNAKSNIFKFQKEEDIAVWYKDNSVCSNLAQLSIAKNRFPYGEYGTVKVESGNYFFENVKICRTDEVALPGKHNEQNICAAIAVTYNLCPQENIVKVLQRFKGLPYHTEEVGTVQGVKFINDSFSVNPTSTIVAIDSFVEDITLLLGGVDRGLNLDELLKHIKEKKNIKNIICYGKFGERVFSEISKDPSINVLIENSKVFSDIFTKAVSLAEAGGVVLFSPGAPSFDMFENYIKRGEKFNELVNSTLL